MIYTIVLLLLGNSGREFEDVADQLIDNFHQNVSTRRDGDDLDEGIRSEFCSFHFNSISCFTVPDDSGLQDDKAQSPSPGEFPGNHKISLAIDQGHDSREVEGDQEIQVQHSPSTSELVTAV